MQQFLTQNAGKWLSQRTCTALGETPDLPRSGKITLLQDVLSPSDPRILDLCQRSQQDPQQVLGGLLTRWDKSSDRRPGSSLYVAIAPDASQVQQTNKIDPIGLFLWSPDQTGAVYPGRYQVTHHSVIWWVETDDIQLEERVWFPGENLRLRSSLYCTPQGQPYQSYFYSEIRLGTATS